MLSENQQSNHSTKIENNPIKGLSYLLSGLSLMTKPGIKAFVVIPLLINISVFIIALLSGFFYFSEFMDKVLDFSGLWDWVASVLNLIKPLLWLVFFVSYLIIVFYSFSLLANIIAAPFNSLLAEATEAYLTGQKPNNNSSMTQVLKQIIPLVWQEIRKLIYFLVRAIPLLILFLIPFTMPLAPFLWFLFSAWMMSLQYMDYPMGNHEISFKQQIKLQKTQRWFSFGYGTGVLVATMIPIINFLIIPVAVISATKIWVDRLSTKNI